MVGAVRFELTTSCTRNKRASQATLRPDIRVKHFARPRRERQCGISRKHPPHLEMLETHKKRIRALACFRPFVDFTVASRPVCQIPHREESPTTPSGPASSCPEPRSRRRWRTLPLAVRCQWFPASHPLKSCQTYPAGRGGAAGAIDSRGLSRIGWRQKWSWI